MGEVFLPLKIQEIIRKTVMVWELLNAKYFSHSPEYLYPLPNPSPKGEVLLLIVSDIYSPSPLGEGDGGRGFMV
jgi:hypothetical protein